MVHQAPDDHEKAKDLALYRDGYRCVATKIFEVNYAMNGDPEAYADIQEIGATAINCAYIIPAYTYFKLSNETEKDYAASVLAVLARFGYNVDTLDGPKIHSLFNVMTLVTVVHDYFDQLKLWFEATTAPHRYEIKCLNPFEPILRNMPSPFTTFTTSDPRLPLPDPALLALHATCAKVAHLSGAGEHIDRVHRDLRHLDCCRCWNLILYHPSDDVSSYTSIHQVIGCYKSEVEDSAKLCLYERDDLQTTKILRSKVSSSTTIGIQRYRSRFSSDSDDLPLPPIATMAELATTTVSQHPMTINLAE
ncbi:hypothetical protein LENED_004325 [Lentinula edodes]|uniref:Uncharacterized protein n=1 Tax=Lentinula edodes TaxID=5353 RepID=A0A1Q3E608_LENED|nr:hypothetical protein LENED_004325 [Lentinula edodes]